MPTLTEVRDAAVELLKKTFPALPRVEAFSGELDLEVAARKRLPPGVTILVAAVSADNEGTALALDMEGTFGVVVVASNRAGREAAEKDVLIAAEKAALTIHGSRFGLTGVSPARVRVLEQVMDEKLAENNLCAWSLVWQQALTFTTGEHDDAV